VVALQANLATLVTREIQALRATQAPQGIQESQGTLLEIRALRATLETQALLALRATLEIQALLAIPGILALQALRAILATLATPEILHPTNLHRLRLCLSPAHSELCCWGSSA
jgi:hypothetical protein